MFELLASRNFCFYTKLISFEFNCPAAYSRPRAIKENAGDRRLQYPLYVQVGRPNTTPQVPCPRYVTKKIFCSQILLVISKLLVATASRLRSSGFWLVARSIGLLLERVPRSKWKEAKVAKVTASIIMKLNVKFGVCSVTYPWKVLHFSLEVKPDFMEEK